MATEMYVGSSVGIKPNTTSGYIDTGVSLDWTKTTIIEMVVRFTSVNDGNGHYAFGTHYTPNLSWGINRTRKMEYGSSWLCNNCYYRSNC